MRLSSIGDLLIELVLEDFQLLALMLWITELCPTKEDTAGRDYLC
jgi:hypothetical protein